MPQRCVPCQAQLADNIKFCTECGSNMLAHAVSSAEKDFTAKQPAAPAPAPAVSQPAAAASSSSASIIAPVPAPKPLGPNTARITMDDHEFKDFVASLSRGLMKDKDQITKIKAAASAHWFTCAQAIAMSDVVKGHPGEAVITLYSALSDADANFDKVLKNLKWIEERVEVIDALKLDKNKYAALLKK